jgi:hypothetical protein
MGKMELRIQHTGEAIISVHRRRRLPPINRSTTQSGMSRGSRSRPHMIGLHTGAGYQTIGVQSQGLGQHHFQSAYFIAAQTETDQIVTFKPEFSISKRFRQSIRPHQRGWIMGENVPGYLTGNTFDNDASVKMLAWSIHNNQLFKVKISGQ